MWFNLIECLLALLALLLEISGSQQVELASGATMNIRKDSFMMAIPESFGRRLIEDTDPLFRHTSTTASRNTFSMGYYSYYSYSMPHQPRTNHPTKAPSHVVTSRTSTRPIYPPSLSSSSSKPHPSPTSEPSSKPLSTNIPTTHGILLTQIPSKVDIFPLSINPTLHPSIWISTITQDHNTTNSTVGHNSTQDHNHNTTNVTAGIEGLGSKPTQKSKVNLKPYIISATLASVVGFASVTALILSRRSRIEPLLFSEDVEDDSLDTVSYA